MVFMGVEEALAGMSVRDASGTPSPNRPFEAMSSNSSSHLMEHSGADKPPSFWSASQNNALMRFIFTIYFV